MRPLGDLKLLSRHKEAAVKKFTPIEDKKRIVRVIWDINTCPLRDADNNFTYKVSELTGFINQALKHLQSDLQTEQTMFAAGNLLLQALSQEDESTIKAMFKFIDCVDREFMCRICKANPTIPTERKTTPEVFTTLQEHMLGDAGDRGPPGIILLISSDYDFHKSLDFLRKQGFFILLACQEDSNSDFFNHAHYRYMWKDLRDGKKPKFERKFVLDSDQQ